MTRVATLANGTELKQSSVWLCQMVALDFASGGIYANDGLHEIVYGGNTYLPIGQLGSIDAVQEQLNVIARPLKMTLSGVDAAIVAKARDEVYQNRTATVYLQPINRLTGQPVAAPEIVWEGRMDLMTISIDKNVGSITLNCEHRLRREPRIARYTDSDQQNAYTGDRFFQFTQVIPGFQSQWGNEKASYSGPGTAPKVVPKFLTPGPRG